MTDAIHAINSAIDFALDSADDGMTFLRMFREGDWPGIQNEFPEYDLSLVGQANLVVMKSVLSLARSKSEGKAMTISTEEAMTKGISALPLSDDS